MDDKAARIAARRQAILNARGDRLARLTSSARGDDPGGVYAQEIQTATKSTLKTFVGEETALPPPSPPPPQPPSANNTPTKPAASSESVPSSTTKTPKTPKTPENSRIRAAAARESATPEWTPQQQEELLKMLLGADAAYSAQPRLPMPPSATTNTASDPLSNSENPENILAQMFSSFNGSADAFMGQQAQTAPPPRRTLGQRLIPVLHLLSMIVLVVWFAVFKEPEQVRLNVASAGVKGIELEDNFGWNRWSRLMSVRPTGDMWSVPTMSSFFWAFTTVELVLHSLRLISKPAPYRPPFLLELALPHLPPPAPKIIITSLQYLQMGGMILNDLAVLIFGIGMVVLISSWKAG